MNEIATVASSVALNGLLVWLTKSWISERLKNAIKHEYDEKLETHKAQLKREYDKEVEEFKAHLQIAAAERNIRLSRVFERTAEAVATTYAKLLTFHRAVEDYTQLLEPSNDPLRLELGKSVQSKSDDFLTYYLPHKIYLPKETTERIRIFSNSLHSLSRRFAMALAVQKAQVRNPETIENLYKKIGELNEQVPELLARLEEDFQQILGLEERKPTSGANASLSKRQ